MKFFPIFRPGKHIDSKGVEHNFTEDAVKKLVDDYNANKDNYDVPLVKGHPKTDDPAYGWVKELKYENGIVSAYPKQLDPAFVQEVKKGAYRYVSVKIGSDGKLKHIGFLGAANPAIKQLGDVKFAEFEDSDKVTVAPLEEFNIQFEENTKDKKDSGLSKEFVELKKELTQEMTNAIKTALSNIGANYNKEFEDTNNNKSGGNMDQKNKKDLFFQKVRDKFGEQAATDLAKLFNESFDGVQFNEKPEPDEKDKRIAELERVNRMNGYKEFVDQTSLTPRQKTIAIELLDIAGNSNQEIEFNENGTNKKYSALDFTKDFIKSIKNPDLRKNMLPGSSYSSNELSHKEYAEAAKLAQGE
jgi:hypothetical protein